jgi:membrane-bound metal-dependent hydrolase YbcI (DUF457 family)
MLGFVSHLLLDAFTRKGIRFAYPFRWVVRGCLRTGKLADWLMFFVFLVLDVLLLVGFFG